MNRRDSLSAPLNGNISTDILYSGDADSELADTLSPKMALKRKSSSSNKIEEELVRQAKRLDAIESHGETCKSDYFECTRLGTSRRRRYRWGGSNGK